MHASGNKDNSLAGIARSILAHIYVHTDNSMHGDSFPSLNSSIEMSSLEQGGVE